MGIAENENAQFMLLAGFIIAIGLVIATALLSNIIFESNMAGEAGIDPLKYDIANLMHIAGDETKSAYRNATELGGDTTKKINSFTNQTQNFSANLPKMFALRGEGVTVSWDVSNWNNSRYPNFTDNGMPGGATSWTLVEGVNASSVDIFKLWNINFTGTSFKIEARNSTDYAVWSVEFNSSGYTATNTSGTSYGSPFTPNEINLLVPPTYYFTESTSASGPVSIRIINGSNAYGKFQIQGIANGRVFIRARDYILNATVSLSTSRMRANFTIPVPVPW